MGGAKILPRPVKVFVGLITNEISLIERMKEALIRRFGDIDLQSDILDFCFTTYYNKEMGSNLKRQFLSFKKLTSSESTNVSTLKLLTNKLEKKFSTQGQRRINIDPGYIALGKLVLLTTKDYYHRIYLGKGIYAEVTLYYKNGTFHPFEWSYPDYKSTEYIDFFNKLRGYYSEQLKALAC